MDPEAKLESLRYCLATGSYEDAAGHLCDLLELCRQNIVSNNGMMFVDLAAMVAKYGEFPRAAS